MKPVLALILLVSLLAVSARGAEQALPDPVKEARAVRLGGEIRCTVCQSESIEDSSADMARDLRHLVREKVAAGWPDDRIVDYLRSRYGDFILLRPPVQANTYALWLAPVLLLLTAGLGLAVFIRRKSGRDGGGGA